MDLGNVSFDGLLEAARRMGARLVDFDIEDKLSTLDSIDVDLAKGIHIELEDVELDNGLLSFKGRQILLYIQDHGGKVAEALENGKVGKKYHVADCLTLKEMRAKKRFERYVVTNDITPEFFITGKDWESGAQIEGMAELKVCKNCLKQLNYQGYVAGGKKYVVFSGFDLEEFFSTYSSFFPHLPVEFAGPAATDKYSDDWAIIAGAYKASVSFVCESCGLDLSMQKGLLHAHHISGVKKNNNSSNLKALCIECHRQQPCHGHMFVSHQDRRLLNELRREQDKLSAADWEAAMKLADPGMLGLLLMCRHSRVPVPRVSHLLQSRHNGERAALELAWPAQKIGVCIDQKDGRAAKAAGWKIFGVDKAIDEFEQFAELLK